MTTAAPSTNGKADIVDAGAELIRRGYLIVPCNGKQPCDDRGQPCDEWQTRPVTIERLIAGLNGAHSPMIGLRFGPGSFIDIEADSADEERAFAELFAGCDVPITPTFASTRGKHRLFAWDDRLAETDAAVVNYRGTNGAKLGIRIGAGGKGAQSIIPPSPGRAWLVSWDDCEPAALPDKVISRIRVAANPKPSATKASTASTNGHATPAALAAMLRHKPDANESDGSKRLFAIACRAVEHDLSDAAAIEAVRQYEQRFPFPVNWSDADIVQRLRDAERKSERGAAVRSDKLKIDTSQRDLSIVTPLAWDALQQSNNPPALFRFGAVASRIERGDNGEPIIKPLGFDMMRHHLARSATWIDWKKVGDDFQERVTVPPKDIVADVLATPDHPLPVLARIVEAPVFASDGTLQTSPGFHAPSQTFFSPAAGFAIPDVPEQPEGMDLESARILIVDELLGDFPFVGDAEIAHAVAILLLPFARDLIDGPTPLHLIEKPSPGTGATLLVDMLSAPFTGRPIPTMTEGRDEDEWRKRITAKLAGGSPFVLIDNLRRRLDSAAVSAGITSTTWEDRILGVSVMARLPVRCAWLATGNNPAVSTEIARRTVRIRMDAKLDRPWLRNGFRHENLRQWAADNRGLLVWSALTMIRAWIVAGRPAGTTTLGMFERWSEVIGGILKFAGVPGFLTNLSEFYEESDAEGTTWRAFLAAWWERFGENETTVKELWHVAADDACLPLGDKGEQSQRIVLGKLLADRRDRVFVLEFADKPLRLQLRRGNQLRRAYRWVLRAMNQV